MMGFVLDDCKCMEENKMYTKIGEINMLINIRTLTFAMFRASTYIQVTIQIS